MNYKKSAEKIIKDYNRYMKAEEWKAAREANRKLQLEIQFRDVSDEMLHYAVQKRKRKMDVFCTLFVFIVVIGMTLGIVEFLYDIISILFNMPNEFMGSLVHSPIYIPIIILSFIVGLGGLSLLGAINQSPAELELERRCKNRLESKNETDRSAKE